MALGLIGLRMVSFNHARNGCFEEFFAKKKVANLNISSNIGNPDPIKIMMKIPIATSLIFIFLVALASFGVHAAEESNWKLIFKNKEETSFYLDAQSLSSPSPGQVGVSLKIVPVKRNGDFVLFSNKYKDAKWAMIMPHSMGANLRKFLCQPRKNVPSLAPSH